MRKGEGKRGDTEKVPSGRTDRQVEDEAKTMEDEAKTGNLIKAEKPREGRRKETRRRTGRCRCCVASVVSDSVRPHRRQPTRLPRPRDSPAKNTGVGCHFLLQCMKVKSEREATQSCLTCSDSMDCSPPGSSVHVLFQARVLEWGAIAFSKEDRRGRLKEGEKEEARKAGEEEQSGSEGGEGLEEAAGPWAGPGQSPGRPPPGIGEMEGWGGVRRSLGGASAVRERVSG